MPISDRASVAVLTSLSPATWTQLSAVPTPQEHGFDHLDVVWICDFKGVVVTALDVANAFPLGARYGTSDFWLRSGMPERVAGNIWSFKAHYEGRLSIAKPVSVRERASQEVFNISSLTITGLCTDAPVNVRECSPTVEIGYVLVGTTPPTNLVGLAGSPTVAPPVRGSSWGSLVDPRFNFPNGWLMTDVDVDKIAGASPAAYWVLESWQYYFDKIPA